MEVIGGVADGNVLSISTFAKYVEIPIWGDDGISGKQRYVQSGGVLWHLPLFNWVHSRDYEWTIENNEKGDTR
jgi:hypothetical protein